MEPSDLRNIDQFTENAGAIFAVEDTLSGTLKAASKILEGVEANKKRQKAKRVDKSDIRKQSGVELELVSIRVRGKKRPVDALKFSKTSADGTELFSFFFELHNLRIGIKSLLEILPVTDEETEMPEKYLSLSFRERQIAVLVGRGMSSAEIADHLCIAENTVKNHRKRMRKRLACNGKAEYNAFLQWAAINGLAD